jgi:small conductance mechanosensitive channel
MNDLLDQLDLRLLSRAVELVPAVLAAAVVIVVFWLLFRMTRGGLTVVLERAGLHRTLVVMLVERVYRMAVLTFALVMAADQVGINVGAALAGIGVVGLAIGFAAQDTLANVIAGFLVFIDKPFEVGDWITVADKYGSVSDITMRSTRIRTNRNTYVVIPNKTIIDTVLINHSKHGETRIDVPIGIAYKEDIVRARDVVLAAVRRVEGIVLKPPPDLVVTELAASSINMNVRVWISDAALEQPVYFRVMEASKLALDAAGIQIPYPHLQLFVEDVDARVWAQAARLAEVPSPSTSVPNPS